MTRASAWGTFPERVEYAARFIARAQTTTTTRAFCGCFEMWDGDAVVVALYRRTKRRPGTKLARNLWRFLSRDSVVSTAWANRRRVDLQAWADELDAAAPKFIPTGAA